MINHKGHMMVTCQSQTKDNTIEEPVLYTETIAHFNQNFYWKTELYDFVRFSADFLRSLQK